LGQTLGTFLTLDGSTKAPSSAKDVAGTLVTGRRLKLILSQLRIGVRRWEQLAADWESRYIAHRCGPGTVFLFAHALLSECPACHCWIEVTEPAPVPNKARGPGFAGRKNSSHDPKEPFTLGAETLRVGSHKPFASQARTLNTNKTGLTRDIEGVGDSESQDREPEEAHVITNHAQLRALLNKDYQEWKERRA
jgi:hypothetical protein